jgi:hypothetical protein
VQLVALVLAFVAVACVRVQMFIGLAFKEIHTYI